MGLHDTIQFEINNVWSRFGRPPTLIRLSSKYIEQLIKENKEVLGINLLGNPIKYTGIEIIEDLKDDDVIKCYID